MTLHLPKPTHRCHASGRELVAGDEYWTALVESPVGTVRHDYGVDAWQGPPEGCLGWWRSRVPDSARPTARLSTEQLRKFVAASDDDKRADCADWEECRYVAALQLIRRKALKLLDVVQADGRDVLVMGTERSGSEVRVVDPGLDEDRIRELRRSLPTVLQATLPGVAGVHESDDAPADVSAQGVAP